MVENQFKIIPYTGLYDIILSRTALSISLDSMIF